MPYYFVSGVARYTADIKYDNVTRDVEIEQAIVAGMDEEQAEGRALIDNEPDWEYDTIDGAWIRGPEICEIPPDQWNTRIGAPTLFDLEAL